MRQVVITASSQERGRNERQYTAHCLSCLQPRPLAHKMAPPAFSVQLAHLDQVSLELHTAQRLILSMILDFVKLQWISAVTEIAQ